MGKTKRGLNPSSSSKAVGRAKLSAQRATELSGNHRNCMYCLSQNKNSCYSLKSQRIHLFERNIVENIESFGENSLLYESSKTFIMLQIGNKYPFDA